MLGDALNVFNNILAIMKELLRIPHEGSEIKHCIHDQNILFATIKKLEQ